MLHHTREIRSNSYRRVHAAIAILLLTLVWGAVSALPAAAQTTDPSGTTTCVPEDPTCDPLANPPNGATEGGGNPDEWDTDVLNSPLRSPGLPPEPALWPALRQVVRQALRDLFGAGPIDRISTEGGR